MRKIPTNSSPPPRKAELPLDLTGPHVTQGASSQHRLYQALCHAITGGIAKPGELLPPSRTLAKQTGFRRNAVTSAYERLIADGFAVATVGSGTFVAARIPARVHDNGKRKIGSSKPDSAGIAFRDWNVKKVKKGKHTLRAKVRDARGRTATASRIVRVCK